MLSKSYYKRIIVKAVYGEIMDKHKKLATIINKHLPALDNIPSLIEYGRQYKKYDDWTIRDFDKAMAYSMKLRSTI